MTNAVMFAHLVGKHIRMERDATRREQAEGEPPTIGMECYVAMVRDVAEKRVVFDIGGLSFVRDADHMKPVRDTRVGHRLGVEIVSDESIAFTVWEDEEKDWRFTIWPDKDTADEFDPEDSHATR